MSGLARKAAAAVASAALLLTGAAKCSFGKIHHARHTRTAPSRTHAKTHRGKPVKSLEQWRLSYMPGTYLSIGTVKPGIDWVLIGYTQELTPVWLRQGS
jgi:hypothetical protein